MEEESRKGAKKGKVQATSAEVILRTNKVVAWIAQKKKRSEIIDLVQAEGWAITASSVDTYIRRAKDEIQEMASKDRALAYVEAVLDLDFMYAQAVADEDYALCLQVRKEKNKLYNLYPKQPNNGSQTGATLGDGVLPGSSKGISEAVQRIVGSHADYQGAPSASSEDRIKEHQRDYAERREHTGARESVLHIETDGNVGIGT